MQIFCKFPNCEASIPNRMGRGGKKDPPPILIKLANMPSKLGLMYFFTAFLLVPKTYPIIFTLYPMIILRMLKMTKIISSNVNTKLGFFGVRPALSRPA